MQTWGWRGNAHGDGVRTKLSDILRTRGLALQGDATETRADVQARVVSDGRDGCMVFCTSSGGLEIAKALTKGLAVAGRFAEVDLHDAAVSASAYSIDATGNAGAGEDLDEDATSLCEEWFDGKRYRPEAGEDLVSMFVGVEGGAPPGGVPLAWVKVGTGRTQALVEAIRAGATWEKTEVSGRVAVRVKGAGATRISFLEADELAAFESAVSET